MASFWQKLRSLFAKPEEPQGHSLLDGLPRVGVPDERGHLAGEVDPSTHETSIVAPDYHVPEGDSAR